MIIIRRKYSQEFKCLPDTDTLNCDTQDTFTVILQDLLSLLIEKTFYKCILNNTFYFIISLVRYAFVCGVKVKAVTFGLFKVGIIKLPFVSLTLIQSVLFT